MPLVISSLVSALLLAVCVPLASAAPVAFINGKIYTANDAQPRAEAVIAENGLITFVGSTAEALRHAPPEARRIELQGRAMFPGFIDAHAHLLGIGERELSFNLEGTTGISDLKARLKQRFETQPGRWVTGRGWIESRWTPAVFPTRADLDAVASVGP